MEISTCSLWVKVNRAIFFCFNCDFKMTVVGFWIKIIIVIQFLESLVVNGN